MARTPPLPTMMQRRQLRLRGEKQGSLQSCPPGFLLPIPLALDPVPLDKCRLGLRRKTDGLLAAFLRGGQNHVVGTWATWNSQTSLIPDTSPGKCGCGQASGTSFRKVRKEDLLRWHSGVKIPQELVGFRHLSGEREKWAGLEGYARKARTEEWDWKLQSSGLGFYSVQQPLCSQKLPGNPIHSSLLPLIMGLPPSRLCWLQSCHCLLDTSHGPSAAPTT